MIQGDFMRNNCRRVRHWLNQRRNNVLWWTRRKKESLRWLHDLFDLFLCRTTFLNHLLGLWKCQVILCCDRERAIYKYPTHWWGEGGSALKIIANITHHTKNTIGKHHAQLSVCKSKSISLSLSLMSPPRLFCRCPSFQHPPPLPCPHHCGWHSSIAAMGISNFRGNEKFANFNLKSKQRKESTLTVSPLVWITNFWWGI